MSDILFYHLETQPLERVLPVLLEKSLERGWKAVVETSSRARAEAIDAMLWTFRDDSFLPHGIAGEPTDPDQPVLIATDGENPNAANVRFFVDRAVPQTRRGIRADRLHVLGPRPGRRHRGARRLEGARAGQHADLLATGRGRALGETRLSACQMGPEA